MSAFFVIFVVAAAAAVAGAGASPQILGLDTFLAHQSSVDREASNDTFVLLPALLKKPLSVSSFSHLSDLTSYLLSLKISVPLHVHLVGPFPASTASLLSSFLSAAVFSDRFHVIGADPHYLALKHTLQLDVDASPFFLSTEISDAVRNHLSNAPSSFRSVLQSVPFSLVDTIVKKDFHKHHAAVPGTHLYLLNSNPVSDSKPYAYAYSPGDSSMAYTKCLGTLYTGDDRYIWIDLAAGPVDYGPALSGDGVLPRGEFHPLAASHGRPKSNKAFVADLASLVWSAYQVLLVPSLRIPVTFENLLIVEFIHVYGSDNIDSHGLDWSSIQETFTDEVRKDGLLLAEQSLKFKKYSTRFSDCPICSFAVSRSTNSYTSRFLFTNYTLIVSEYLDSKRLHQILLDSTDELRRSIGIEEEEFGRIIPVYVFDLDYDRLLLLDRYHQAVAFKDMVIAVRTRSSQTVSDYSCNGRHVITQTRELERPLVGSILQSMWGVSPTHLMWSSRHNSTLVDYTWSVGQTPFGPFSETSSLSFVQKDAARRNLILTSLNYTIASAIDALESMAGHGGDRRLLKKNRHVEFVQRWNLFKYKLDKAISALSHLDYQMALFFLRSSDHDLFSIHTLVYQASQELEASLTFLACSCFRGTDSRVVIYELHLTN
ncbi:hypothetical protein H6P81_004626 [Aristolochia fimbriata]|uniref:DUF7906 domain-containing protein n=1 Tax=Aristolochia fimbriata TaxID=158543 RepID=A0AAV7EVT2_ARIFI|nr:hypothetical protein H6P81_004626 [Aristolochia fimbriata]